MKIEICIAIISCYITLIAAKCPTSAAVLSPCKCEVYQNASYIYCGGNTTYNIRNVFISLSNALLDDEKHFKSFYFNNTVINEIPMNVFYDITFDRVEIERAYNLTKINSLAFIPYASRITEFSIYNVPYGANMSDTHNIFDAINTMTNVNYVQLYNTSVTSIPPNAFSLLKNLSSLYFLQNKNLVSVGNYAFYELNNLTTLLFDGNSFEYIPEHALSFRVRSNTTLGLYFYNMANLTIKGFSTATFTSVNRRFSLYLVNDPQIHYLDDTVFNTVLANGNEIHLSNTRLECDCKMYWLYANKAQYQPLLFNAYCTDGTSVFTERQNYTGCGNVPLLKFKL